MTTAPYDPRSGNTPDAKPLDIAGMRYQAQYKPTPPAVFTPVDEIITQSGEVIPVDASGRSESGGTPVGTVKPVEGRDFPVGGTPPGGPTGPATPIVPAGGTDTTVQDYIKSLQNKVNATTTAAQAERISAYNILRNEFSKYGLSSLVDGIKGLLEDGTPASEFGLKLRETSAYQTRFSANADRIKAGLSALSPAEYVGLEDQYQSIMRNAGLPSSYYTKDATGKQVGFEKFIAGDVSALELQDRISTAQKRVINANPEVTSALKQFYPDITNGDILAYTLDPTQGLESIKRKVTAAEIGGAALQSGLTTNLARAQELAGYGVDKAQATAGYSTIGGGLQRGSELASIYGEAPYTQATAESEVFKLGSAQEARKQRQKVTGLEKATFGGQSGLATGALARDRAGGY